MEPFLRYLIQANVALSLFFILYLMVLRRDTFLQLRRFFFLSVILFSLLYPFITLSTPGLLIGFFSRTSPQADVSILIGEPVMTTVQAGVVDSPRTIPWEILFSLMYAIGILFCFFRFVSQLISLWRIRKKSQLEAICGIPVYRLRDDAPPFSFFHLIFIHTQKHTDAELNQILLHEQTHAKQVHSADILLIELLCILFWWNPFVWLMKREMAMNLEYLADQGVLTQGVNSREYQYHLLRLTFQETAVSIVNNFNVSQIKQRIMMMNQSKSPLYKLGRYLLILPLALLFVTANSLYAAEREPADEESGALTPVVEELTQERSPVSAVVEEGSPEPEQAVVQEQSLNNPPPEKQKEEIFEVVENPPEFPGGNAAMMKFLSDSIRYPVAAQKKGIQGRVICHFVVNKDGRIGDLQVARGVDPALDAEALRVLGLMPDWKPGKQRGQPVNVRYTVPIVFNLNNTPPTDAQKQAFQEKMKNMEPAIFPGGEEAYMRFLADNIKYPVIAQENGIQGLVEALYNIDTKGKVTFVRIVKGVDPSLDKEVIRVIGLMPDWTPAKLNGEATGMTTGAQFFFRLEGGDKVEPLRGEIPENAIVVVGYAVK
ncbi:MAG: M56 family metallopeptidase [Proteiniphilum sp.]|nr:M56 family metallopeptidase [Proteiniphilum sp.]